MHAIHNYIFTVFTLLLFQANLVAQQTPCTALPLTFASSDCGAVSSVVTGNFGAATASGLGDPGGCGSGVFSNGRNDYFVSAVVPADQQGIRFQMTWSGCGLFCVSNPGWAVYIANAGNCNNLTPLICGGDDSFSPSSSFDVSITSLQPGDLLIARVWETDNQDSDIEIQAVVIPPNDFCSDALPLQGTGCNYQASDLGEPDSWAPNQSMAGNNCAGGDWSSNENGVWYTFTVDATTPQPISIQILNVVCDNTGGGNMQMGIWTNSNSCDLGIETLVECAVGVGNVAVGPMNLALGDYYLFVDGNAGANCEWEFESQEILPIELSRFSGKIEQQQTFLDWSTSSEHNNDYFEVLHSINGTDFAVIGEQPALGGPGQLQTYSFLHPRPIPGENYYRLKQVDQDGRFTFSRIIALSYKKSSILEVYPNPLVGETLFFDVEGFDPANIELKITDSAGRLVIAETINYKNQSTIQVELPGLSRGIYFYSIGSGGIHAHNGKFVR